MSTLGGDSTSRDQRVGTVVQGRYRIIDRLGAGGMGMVYLGEHLMIRRKVAIKTLHAQFAQNPDIVARFHREALAATSIGNQHIVEVLDMGHFDDDGSLYMVLEFLEGRDFGAVIEKDGPQPLGRVVRILVQMCEALSAVHAQGIVHRDLKPENVFLIQRGDNPDFVKVLDFGISKFKSSLDDSGGKMTATGAALGTPYYMAPEQTQGLPTIDHRADIYALGAMMYYALLGSHPLEATNLPMLFVKICTEEPQRLRSLRPDLPEEIEGIVHRLLAKRPEARFASCEELRSALLPFASFDGPVPAVRPTKKEPTDDQLFAPTQLGDSAASPAVTAPAGNRSLVVSSHTLAASRPKRSNVPLVAGAAALVLVALAGGYALSQRSPTAVAESGEAPGSAAQPTPSAELAPAPRTVAEAPRIDANAPSVRVSITTEPENAELYFDGNRIANPFDAELPQTKEPRILEARLAGYDTLKQELVLLYPQKVRLTLNKPGAPAAARAATPRVTTPAAASPTPARETAPAQTAAPSAPPAATAAAATPPPASAPAKEKGGRALKTPF